MSSSKVKCFKCSAIITRQYVLSKNGYSQKNNWGYWTEKEENKDKYICNFCLLTLYRKDKGEYLKEVQSNKKRAVFRVYVHNRTIS